MLTGAPSAVLAHDPGKALNASCVITDTAGSAKMEVEVVNQTQDSVKNVRPGQMLASNAGSASIFFQVSPRPVRELLPGKSTRLIWKGRLYGDGYLDLTVIVNADSRGGVVSSGFTNCNRVAVGDTSSIAKPPTPTRPPAPTARPTNPAQATPTSRSGTNVTPGRVPTSAGRPTRTPIPTQRARPTRTPIQFRPTRTPLGQGRPTSTMRPTRTPLVPRPTRTPIAPRPTSTRRPTRTPLGGGPTPTRGIPGQHWNPENLNVQCSLRRTIDMVTVTMIVENRTGSDIRNLAASRLELDPEGAAIFFDRSGPNPDTYSLVRNGFSASFQWSGQLSQGGTMGFSAYVAGIAPDNEVIQTDLVDCGVTTAEGGAFDPAGFAGTCTIDPGRNGRVRFQVSNRTGASLTDVVPRLVAQNNSGSAQILGLAGPVPRDSRRLAQGQSVTYAWRARILGRGQITMQFEGSATRPSGDRVKTGAVTCSVRLNEGGALPDLGVDQEDLGRSVRFTTENFGPNHCAVVEGCLSGTGRRRLLRFNTTTPNYGPGDLFVGDPAGNPSFVFSDCHGHFHFEDYADYRLLDLQGNLVARGHKQAFCLLDLNPIPGVAGPSNPQFPDCGFQGISAGWADVYHNSLDCQWIDITGVPEGRYVLEVTVNPARVVEEMNYGNNTARAEVFVPAE